MTTENEARVVLGTLSGEQISAQKIMLFPEHEFQKVVALKTKAQEELGGFSSGIGFWGSPGWVLGGAAALGFVESIISNAKTKKGLELLKQAAQQSDLVRANGRFISVEQIEGIVHPDPAAWRATEQSVFELDFKPMSLIEKGQAVQRHGLSSKDIKAGKATVSGPVGYIHNNDEFVWVDIDGRPTAVRWSSVAWYRPEIKR